MGSASALGVSYAPQHPVDWLPLVMAQAQTKPAIATTAHLRGATTPGNGGGLLPNGA
jgi:hypothetical protein